MGGVVNSVVGSLFGNQGATSGANGAANQVTQQLSALQPQEAAFGKQLAAQAAGTAPSISAGMLQQANDQNLNNQMAAAKSNRAVNPALAQRNLMEQAGQQNQQTAQAAGIQRLQEQQANQGQFANYLNSLRSAQNGANQNALAGQQQSNGLGGALLSGIGGALGPVGGMIGSMFGGGGSGSGASAGDAMQMPMETINAAHGGVIPKLSGPQSGIGQKMRNMKSGGHVPGQASVSGDSAKNDTVPAMLSPGEVVIPRSVMSAKDPSVAAAKFVQAVLSKKGKGRK
jgi:hypothetical protein